MAYRDENEALRAALAAKDDEIAHLRRAQEAPAFTPHAPNEQLPTTQTRRDLELEAERELIRLRSSIQSGQSNRRAAGPTFTLAAVTCALVAIWSFWRAFAKAEPAMLLLAIAVGFVGGASARSSPTPR
ncbi:MAG: hypothetical protein QOI41_4720, partial [Myxococcales bacterium]|nr:hypothetical protein [Myxococcales bacterium]